MKIKLFSYNQLDTFIHHLSGLTKLVCFLFLTTTVMLTYDIRVILFVLVLSFAMFKVAKIQFKQVKLMLIYVFIFLFTNFILTFIFAPMQGVEIYGTEHILFRIAGPYVVTLEQLFYQTTKLLKYLSVIPLGIIFFLTTNPSELASSLNKVKISYKACTALSLTLRYFPDVQRDYHSISLAQQARGIDLSKKEKITKRFRNILTILTPLIFTTLDRIELITNAMELRGYGKYKTRTWYSYHPLTRNDVLAMLVCLAIFVASLLISAFVNHGIYFNPFI
ncbi:energy-coupling factor transporter transmembrane component T family protein [Anaerorhabdus sp.]|uniref:energy-coupling factor transporter transmembrane component T family protein n=1 Tax=Anaerorhabdus sp. TaxID=1872524 RepID=UPI002B1FC0A5|nr:energy-coupling factor transporter transmembrane component T [Anaerorhabdus sp.]MEA4875696.1 energy-coupling factor transporter transmembrane component T [Anaerorhabdus sp.]